MTNSRHRSIGSCLCAALALALSGCVLFQKKTDPAAEPESREVLTATVESTDEPIVLLPEETRGGTTPEDEAIRNLPADAIILEPRENWFSSIWQKVFPKRDRPPAALPPRWLGRITLVDERSNYALVDSQPFAPLPPGTILHSVSQNSETGVLRVSDDSNPPFFIADITSGRPRPGDRIYSPEQSNTTQQN